MGIPVMAEQGLPIQRRYLLQAQAIASRLPRVLAGRGLEAHFAEFVLTASQGVVLLFAVLDVPHIRRLEAYMTPQLLHHLSTALRGLPVILSNSNGLRYAIPLSPLPRLPRMVKFPGTVRGEFLMGVNHSGEVIRAAWGDLGHLLVAGKTGSGKSVFLRSLAYQALHDEAQLLAADLDGATFPMFAGHSGLLAPVATHPDQAARLVARALGECEHRATLYGRVSGYPETIDEYNRLAIRQGDQPLPRLVVVLDEFSALVTALGGPRGSFANQVAGLGWRGRKFGIHLVFAAQDFTKQVVGRVRDQVSAAICFRVRSREVARLMGCAEAARIPENRPGLAYTDRWGLVQTFYLDKAQIAQFGNKPVLDGSSCSWPIGRWPRRDGKMSIPLLTSWGIPERKARALVEAWELRGWLKQDRYRQNARYITPKLSALLAAFASNAKSLSNHLTPQTSSNPTIPMMRSINDANHLCHLEPEGRGRQDDHRRHPGSRPGAAALPGVAGRSRHAGQCGRQPGAVRRRRPAPAALP
jgi:hypothetical protein